MGLPKYFLLMLAILVVACGAETTGDPSDGVENGGNGGKADSTGKLVGNVINGTQREVDFTQLQDPIAEHVFRSGDSLPTDFAATIDKLAKFDDEGCASPTDAMQTFVVSETAQILDRPTNYRTFTQRECGDRERFGLIFSLFGVTTDGGLPPNAEVMAFDESAGVFNFYEVSNGKWEFFGDSHDIIKGQAGRCASCHNGGGLVMKELDTPWLHWEGHHTTPGAREVVQNNSEFLGKHGSSAATTERIVKRGNDRWNETRLETLVAEQDLRALLEPLFCTIEVNIDNGTDFANRPMRRIPTDFLLDPQLKRFGADVPMDDAIYEAQIAAANQRVPGLEEVHADTIFKFTFPERSHIDNDFVDKLQKAGIVDADFVKDVLMVDFTRPIFSRDRCALLEFVPAADELEPCCRTCSTGQACGDACIGADSTCSQPTGCACGETGPLTADRVRDGLIAKLQAAQVGEGSAAGDLLSNLQDREDSATHDATVDAFIDACRARDKESFMSDVLNVVSRARSEASNMHVFEFPQTMPVDDLRPSGNAHLDPVTCELNQ